MKKLLIILLIPAVIIFGGVRAAIFLKNRAGTAKHEEPSELVTSVETFVATAADMPVHLQVTGAVRAAKQVTVVPEVTGRIVKLSKNLIPGSRFKKGQLIARIDPKDYLLNLTQEKSRVDQANLDLQVERGRAAVAEEEWKLIVGDLAEDESVSELALRKPQLQVAEQQTVTARSGVERARLNLQRTVLRAPFNAMVLEKKVDEGQLVGPTTPVAALMGTDELWVTVSVPVAQLASIDIPGVNAKKGSEATVIQRVGPGNTIVRKGEVIRLQGQLDAQNRTANLLVSIKDPFGGEETDLPLLAGAYVEVKIVGRDMSGVFEIPREGLREDAFVWLADKKNRLEKAPVTVGWGTRNQVVITHGLKDGDRIVVSPLSFPMEGMHVKEVNGNGGERTATREGSSASKESARP